MRKEIFGRIKKTTSILLAVLLVVSLTAASGAACTNTATTPTTSNTNTYTFTPSELGAFIASLLNGLYGSSNLQDTSSSNDLGLPSELNDYLNV